MILSNGNSHIRRLIQVFNERNASAAFLVEKVEEPRRYGVVDGVEISEEIFKVKRIVEKPRITRSNMAVVAIYFFKPVIYREIEEVKPDSEGEIQLTNAINGLIHHGIQSTPLKLGEKGESMLGRQKHIGMHWTWHRNFETIVQQSFYEIPTFPENLRVFY